MDREGLHTVHSKSTVISCPSWSQSEDLQGQCLFLDFSFRCFFLFSFSFLRSDFLCLRSNSKSCTALSTEINVSCDSIHVSFGKVQWEFGYMATCEGF